MNKRIYIIILLLTCRICEAQNLISNGDFEQYYSCPTAVSQIDTAFYWVGTSTSGLARADYFNQCSPPGIVGIPNNIFGHQNTHSGSGYCGMQLWYESTPNIREYIETELASPLSANTCYHFEMYVNLANGCNYTTDAVQIYFSDSLISAISYSYPLPFTPQINNSSGNVFDTLNWTLVSGNYTAIGGENYLIIGNFMYDSMTTTILIGTTQENVSYIYIDDVSLVQIPPCNTGIEEQNGNVELKFYPNPFNTKLTVIEKNNELSEIILYDIASRKLLQQKFTNSVSLSTEQLAKGIYIYEVRNKNGLCKKGKVVKD